MQRNHVPQSNRRWRARAAAVSILAAAGLAVAGCAGSAPTVGTASSASVLTVGDPQPPTSLDPAIGTSGGDYVYLYMIYARLLSFNQTTGAIEPGLATSWGFTGKDNLTFDLTLRKGARFQDGEPVTASAVAYSLRRYQQLKVQTDLEAVSSITTTGTYSLALHLSSPDSALPASLADRAGMIVCPKAAQEDGKNFASEPCGAGSYQVTSEVSGSSINLKRFSGYYGGTPAYSTVTWTIFSTATAMETAARSGQLDVALQAPAADVSQLRGSSDFSVNVGPSLLYTQVYLDDAEKPFNNVDVRLAFNYAINRTALIEAVNGGPGTPAWQPVSAGNPFYSKTLGATYPYDPARARSLMAKAGDAGGVSFTCVDFPGLNFETAGPILQQEEAAVGIHIKILEESISEALAQSAEGVYPCSFSAWTGRPDPALALSDLYDSNGIYNIGKTNFGLDGLINKVLSSYGTSDRIAAVQAAVAASIPEAPDAPLVYAPSVTLVSPSVSGFVNNFQGKEDLSLVRPAS